MFTKINIMVIVEEAYKVLGSSAEVRVSITPYNTLRISVNYLEGKTIHHYFDEFTKTFVASSSFSQVETMMIDGIHYLKKTEK